MGIEFPNRPAIAARQLGQLRQLIGTLLPRNSFYQKKLSGNRSRRSGPGGFFAAFPVYDQGGIGGGPARGAALRRQPYFSP